MKVLERKMRKSQFDQSILGAVRKLPELFIVLLVPHQILQIRVSECPKEAVAVRPCLADGLVFGCQIAHLRPVDGIVIVFAVEHGNGLRFADERNGVRNLSKEVNTFM